MGLINRLHTFATMPGISPDIGAKIDAELNTVFNAVNGNLDDSNIDGSPAIQSSKLSLGGAGFLPLAGGSLTAVLNHAFEGIWRSMGLVGTSGLVREYRSLSGGNIVWGIAYNTFYNGGWQGRDISDICLRVELTKTSDGWGGLRVYTADSLGGGVPPTWNHAQHYAPMGGTGELGNEPSAITETGKSGIFHYNTLTIPSGITWTLAQGKPLIIFARESVTISGTIDGNGKGAAGGAMNTTGQSSIAGGAGGAGGAGSTAFTGKDGGSSEYLGFLSSGGAGTTTNGNNGDSSLISKLISLYSNVGGGGGGGGSNPSGGTPGSGGTGGYGGGCVHIVAPIVKIETTGIIQCNGGNGIAGVAGTYHTGGGGGGGGGVIYLHAKKIINSGTLSVIQGNGANGSSSNKVGGNGGAGVIYIEEYR